MAERLEKRMSTLVLCYHTVGQWQHEMSVPVGQLHRQVAELLRRGYRADTFTRAVTSPAHAKTLAITFDDGFRAVYEEAFPLLDAMGVPATVFLPTGFVGTGAPMSWPGWDQGPSPSARQLLPMTWADARALAASGWEIGSHTVTHPRLTDLGLDELRHQLATSRAACESALAAPCRAVAYPFGAVDGRVAEAARLAGYQAGAALAWAGRPDVMTVPRVSSYPIDGPLRFRLKTSLPVRTSLAARLVRTVAPVWRG